MRHLNKKLRLRAALVPVLGILFVLGWMVYSFMHMSPFAASWDEVDFVLALDRFDLLAMQPHFPGYPYFVLGAMAVRQFGIDPVHAYAVLNILLTASAVMPIWLLSRRILSPIWSLLAVLLILTSPYLWLQALRPMSEAAGIAVLWWFLWSWWRAMEHRTWASAWIVLFLFGLLMGVRLSFVPFGLSLVWLAAILMKQWRSQGKRPVPRAVVFIALAGFFQLLWVAGLALSEGGFIGFVELAAAFTEGHFDKWGGGVASAPDVSFAERALRFAGDNVLWTGMFARSAALLGAAAALLLAAVLSAGASRAPRLAASRGPRLAARAAAWLSRPPLPGALAMLAGAYGAWALLAQNIDKPRHITPLIGVMWLLLLALFRAAPPQPPLAAPNPRALRSRRALQTAGAILAAGIITLQAAQGGLLAAQQASQRPAVYQLAGALQSAPAPGSTVLYTWEETRVLEYLHTPIPSRRIETYNYFIADIQANPDATILLTDHVLKGFEAQVGPLQAKVREVAHYRSQSLFDPVYHDITVYEWIR
ncbi:ArnT family glycosyltransferase [Paenibacillus solisilvae]|uniref:ArnT family glycosyltransferase n=1 Tax=Paenibacillus solisilvae TaxID=2486751 RepID=A0ABW0VR19_9BACL